MAHTEADVRAALDRVVEDFNTRFPSDTHTYKIAISRDDGSWEILMYGASNNSGGNIAQFRQAIDAVHRTMPIISPA